MSYEVDSLIERWCKASGVVFLSAHVSLDGAHKSYTMARAGRTVILSLMSDPKSVGGFSSSMLSVLRLLSYCKSFDDLKLANPDSNLSSVLITDSLPTPDVLDFLAERGIYFCLERNVIDRIESITL